MRFKMTVSYDGANYHGFQKQTNGLGIQTVLENALKKITKTDTAIVGSGRTDKGVHAIGQVCHFDSSVEMSEANWIRAINSFLPLDIRVTDITFVSDDFHARFDAVKKSYKYVINRKFDLFQRDHQTYVYYDLDVALMKICLNDFIGKHDFFGFSSFVLNKPTVKEIFEATLDVEGDLITITFVANSFLKYMVRSMVGTLIDIGRGHLDAQTIKNTLKNKDRNQAGHTAKPEGLYLECVYYE